MRKTFRAVALALVLAMPVAGGAVFSGCSAVGGVFESDPVGASLLTIKASYESSVKTAGRLYVQGLITEAQLRKFRDQAVKFHASYEKVVAAHAEVKLSENDIRFKNLKLALVALESLVASFTS